MARRKIEDELEALPEDASAQPRARIVVNGGVVVEFPVRILEMVREGVYRVEPEEQPRGLTIKGPLELEVGESAPCLIGRVTT